MSALKTEVRTAQTRKKKILEDVKRARRRRAIISAVVVAVLAVSIIAGIMFLTPHPPTGSNLINTPISATMYSQLRGVSNSTLATVASGQGATPMTTIPGSLLTYNGKPEFLYIGADFCPYCAAERWSIIVALSKFGSFSGLEYMLSSDAPGEPYPNTPTFTFYHATYSSPYIAFVSVETMDRNRNPLQPTTMDQQNLMNQYDCYNSQCGGIAFIDIANQWVMATQSHAGSQFSPGALSGNWTEIGSQLNNPRTAIAQAVDGAANYLITAICNVDNHQPSSLCGQSFAGLVQAPIGMSNAPPANNFNIVVAPTAKPTFWFARMSSIDDKSGNLGSPLKGPVPSTLL